MKFISSSTDTFEELRQKLTRNFIFGSLIYVADTKVAEQIKVIYGLDQDKPLVTEDPWNYWVFNISADATMFSEESRSSRYYNSSVSAGRTTDNWKINISTYGAYQKSRNTLSDGSRILSSNESYSVSSSVIKSFGQHWGIGSGTTLERNSFYNLSPSYKLVMAAEYNIFPYKHSSDRIFTVNYQAGLVDLAYEERTIFEKTNETLFTQRVGMNLNAKRPWGNVGIGTYFSQLGDSGNVRLVVGGDTDWRITRGLSLNFRGQIKLIRDQVYLSGAGITLEEILLQQRAQATGFDKYFGFGFTYRFGSIYNNIVNSRFSSTSFGIF